MIMPKGIPETDVGISVTGEWIGEARCGSVRTERY